MFGSRELGGTNVLLPNKVIIRVKGLGREREFIVLLNVSTFNHDGKIKR